MRCKLKALSERIGNPRSQEIGWNFRIIPMGEDQNIGFTQKWYSQPLQLVRYALI